MNPQNPLAVARFFETDGIIEVFGVRWIDGDDPRVCLILSVVAGSGIE